MEHSLNQASFRVGQTVGAKKISKFLSSLIPHGAISAVPALSLGAADSTLLELAAAYSIFPNLGEAVTPHTIRSVVSDEGEALISASQRRKVVSKESAYLITSMLQDVVRQGTGTKAIPKNFDIEVAGKTGTSNEGRDAWFIGYTPELVVGVWTGFDDNRATELTGGKAAAPIFNSFISCVRPYLTAKTFERPQSITDTFLYAPEPELYGEEYQLPKGFQARDLTLRTVRAQPPEGYRTISTPSGNAAYSGVVYKYDRANEELSAAPSHG